MSQWDDLPVRTGDPWGVIFDSPFTTTAEDVIKWLFFDEWRQLGRVPSAHAIHRRLHRKGHGHLCPGRMRVKQLCNQFKRQIT